MPFQPASCSIQSQQADLYVYESHILFCIQSRFKPRKTCTPSRQLSDPCPQKTCICRSHPSCQTQAAALSIHMRSLELSKCSGANKNMNALDGTQMGIRLQAVLLLIRHVEAKTLPAHDVPSRPIFLLHRIFNEFRSGLWGVTRGHS